MTQQITYKQKVEGLPLIGGYLGYILILAGFITLLPLLVLPFYPDEITQAKYFIIPGIASILAGYLLTFIIKGKEKGNLHKNQDAVIVVLAWAISILVCAVPFMLTGKYNFTQAVFEATSGFSTTGLSVVDVTICPHIFLMYRSIMLFFGGIGLVLVMTSAMSDAHGMRLYSAEGHSDKLMPNLVRSARLIITIYTSYIIAGTVLYVIFGMPLFDALNHSIASLSTGGFSTQAASIGAYNSVPIEIITIVLMLLGETNFLVHLLLLKGKFKAALTHCETKFTLVTVAVSTVLVAVLLSGGVLGTLPENIRIAAFQTVSALTTTGFQTVPTFTTWSSALLLVMTVLMLIGGGTGATAGGIKQYRVAVFFKSVYWAIRDMASHKRNVRADKINRFGNFEKCDKKTQFDVIMFIGIYLGIFLIGTFIFTLYGNSIEASAFEFSSALSTVGLSIGITGYNAPAGVLWTGSVGMFIGRLEIYIVFLGIYRICSDLKSITGKVKR